MPESPQGALSLCQDLIALHRDQGSPPVVPVLVTPWAPWAKLVTAAVATQGGSVVVESDHATGVTTGVNVATAMPELVAAVEEALADLGLDLQLSVDGDFVAVERPEVPFEGLNAASQVLCGALAALFHPAVREDALCLLVVRDGDLDLDHSRRLSDLVAAVPGLLDLPKGRTLVLVGQDTRLQVDRHCDSDHPVRFDLSESRYLRRQSPAQSQRAVESLVNVPHEDCPLIVLCIGAGVGVSLGLPTGNELRDRAIRTYLGTKADDTNSPDELGRMFFAALGKSPGRLRDHEVDEDTFVRQLTLERVLREENHVQGLTFSSTLKRFRERHDQVLAGMAAGALATPLAKLAQLQGRVVIVTVNFDGILEHDAGELVRPFITDDELGALGDYLEAYANDGGAVPYVKLHGDLGVESSIVATIDQTEAGLSAARVQAIRTLRGFRSEQAPVRPWVYIGYSMRDLDVNEVIGSTEFAKDLIEHWVSPLSDVAIGEFIASSRLTAWSRANFQYTAEERTITLTAASFLAALAEGLAP